MTQQGSVPKLSVLGMLPGVQYLGQNGRQRWIWIQWSRVHEEPKKKPRKGMHTGFGNMRQRASARASVPKVLTGGIAVEIAALRERLREILQS